MIALRTSAPLDSLLAGYPVASKQLLDGRALLLRVDSKFVLPARDLGEILDELGEHYAVLRVPAGSVATYRSLYFDTPELRCYHDHRRGRRVRHKVRIRHYPDRALSFLEVKTKRNERVTDKHRLALPYGHDRLGPRELEFLRGQVGEMADGLVPAIWIGFRRISLIGLHTPERVTIDLDLDVAGLETISIIEVKQSPFCVRTPVMRAMLGAGLREGSMSKYTTAIALTRPELRRNRLLPDLRNLERITIP